MIGELLGPYRLQTELGSGGMGTVYLATVVEKVPGVPLGDRVAVKVIHPHLVTDFGMFERFVREVDVGKRIRHENVVRTLDAGMAVHDDGETVYLVMEYVAGRTLGDMRWEMTKLPEHTCRRVARAVTRGLRGIHAAGVIHRDLKPDNVLITPDDVVKVMDLGVAHLHGEALRKSQPGEFAGSLMYAAPELFGADGPEVDGRVDLYSLGVLLYELASGVNPFADDDVRVVIHRQLTFEPVLLNQIDPEISPFLSELIAQLLEKDPENRPRSAGELFTILQDSENSRWWRRRTARMMRGGRPPLRRLKVPRRTGVHGREAELSELRRLFADVKEGGGRVVLIEGEPGIGKSRLADEFAGALELEGEDVEFLFGGHAPAGDGPAHEALMTAFRDHFGPETLATVAREPADTEGPARSALLRLIEGHDEGGWTEPGPSRALHGFFQQALLAAVRERPVVLLVEDLNAAPEAGPDLLLALARAIGEQRVLLLVTARQARDPGWRSDLAALPFASRLALGRLDTAALTRVLGEALGTGAPDELLVAAVAEQSDGNPLFALEVLQTHRERDLLQQNRRGTWSSVRLLQELEIPDVVRGVIEKRLSGVDDDDRDLLQAAACIGTAFDAGLVAEIVGRERLPTSRRFARLAKTRRLVRIAGTGFAFDSRPLRDTLYAELPDMLREEYHRIIGESLVKRAETPAGRPGRLQGEPAAKVAWHLLRGGRPRSALPYLDAALAHLAEQDRHRDVVALAETALSGEGIVAGAARVRILLRQSLGLGAQDRLADALETVQAALALLDAEADEANDSD